MPSITAYLADPLRSILGLTRAVETGTFRGDGARRLAALFPEVVTVELSHKLHAAAAKNLADVPNIRALHGNSAELLPKLADQAVPTLWFLDGHFSMGETAGAASECPVLDELAAIAGGSDRDAIVVDDARLFLARPLPPHNPDHWPTMPEIVDAIRFAKPGYYITIINDQIIGVPQQGASVLDEYGRDPAANALALRDAIRSVGRSVKYRKWQRVGVMS